MMGLHRPVRIIIIIMMISCGHDDDDDVRLVVGVMMMIEIFPVGFVDRLLHHHSLP